MANILIIDDDPAVGRMLSVAMTRLSHHAHHSLTLKEGLNEIFAKAYDVVFLDVHLPDGNGLEALPRIRESRQAPEVIIVTGEGDPDGAELAIKSGAWDYLTKPPSIKALTLPLNRVLKYREEKLARQQQTRLNRAGIIGHSPAITRCLDGVLQAAKTEADILITGETGTGKELFANAIHQNSRRSRGNFVVVDCSALPETLVESTLFGHEKGAFTGAETSREGLVKQADGGTLFLDEVGELSLSVQKSFLRVLQERRFRPVGGKKEIDSRFRLIAATHRNLDQLVMAGQFREDLLYRIRSITLDLPPLRKRKSDILEIAFYHLTRFCDRYETGTKGLAPEFIDALSAYDWPGNIRELVNCLESALAAAGSEPTLIPMHLPTRIRVHLARTAITRTQAVDRDGPSMPAAADSLGRFRDFRDAVVRDAERDYLTRLMKLTGGRVKAACEISDLSRARLYALLKKHAVTR